LFIHAARWPHSTSLGGFQRRRPFCHLCLLWNLLLLRCRVCLENLSYRAGLHVISDRRKLCTVRNLRASLRFAFLPSPRSPYPSLRPTSASFRNERAYFCKEARRSSPKVTGHLNRERRSW